MEGQELIHAVILSLLLFFGIIICGIYLASIKAGTKRVNATEALQICTSILVFFGLILFMPLEIYSLVAVDTHYQALCVARGMLENLLLESQPMAILAIAITRLRASFCKGNSSVLVTKSSAYITLLTFLAFPALSSLVTFTILIMSSADKRDQSMMAANTSTTRFYLAHCIRPVENFSVTYRIFTLVSLDALPIAITCSVYVIIYLRMLAVKTSFKFERQKRFYKEIKRSIIVLLVIVTMSWFPYISIMFRMLNAKVTEAYFLVPFVVYIEMSLYILPPFSEGFLHPRRRKNTFVLLRGIFNKSKVGIDHTDDEITESQFSRNRKHFGKTNPVSDTIIETTEEVVYTSRKSCDNYHCHSDGDSCHNTETCARRTMPSLILVDALTHRTPSPQEKAFDNILTIPSESEAELTDVNRFCSALKIAPLMKNDIRSSFSTESQISDTYGSCSCESRNISKVSSNSSISARSQRGRCHRHSLYRVQSNKNLLIAVHEGTKRPESPTIFFLDTVEGPPCRPESETSDISEYF